MRILARSLFLAAAILPSGAARADTTIDRSVLSACNAVGDLFSTLVRNGDRANAKTLEPQVQKCLAIQRAELKRQTGEVAKASDALIERDTKHPVGSAK